MAAAPKGPLKHEIAARERQYLVSEG
jgi:hypothetical protein